MNFAITVSNGIITGYHESIRPITKETFAESKAFVDDDVFSVPEGADIREGIPMASYNNDWTLKPLSQRVAESLITIDNGYVLDGEEIRPMTPQERIDAGLDPAPEEPDPIDERQMRIIQLKAELAATDYMVIKCYEYSLAGLNFPYDATALYVERQAMRDEINTLEEQLQETV